MNKFRRIPLASTLTMSKRYSSNFDEFRTILKHAKNIVALTGAGVSAESGIPVFRGAGGLWRTHRATDLATPTAFRANPGLVWEFYHYRREVAFNAQPNKAHIALAQYEQQCKKEGRNFALITQNVDGLHKKAGSREIVELHGSLDRTICTKCKSIEVNDKSPICEALRGRGDPAEKDGTQPEIDVKDLPKCSKCGSLVRPYIVWFGENLDPAVLDKSKQLIETCDLCLVVGTSSVVYPAAMFAPTVLQRGKPVAEFNINDEPYSDYTFYFPGQCGQTLPKALGLE